MANLRATSSRRRPLHTCAASMLGIMDVAYRRSQQLDGPLGNFTKRLTTLATSAIPFTSTIKHLGLTVLSVTDDHILFFQRIAESVFPPSGRVFDKIDTLVCSAERLPIRFDEALNSFPSMMHQIPFLDWVLMHLIWWLNFLISFLTHFGSTHTKEKEIMIDMNYHPFDNNPIESPKKPDYSGEAQEQFMLSSGEFIESPIKANESADKVNSYESLGQSIVVSNEFVESAVIENFNEPLGESIDKENSDGQSIVGNNESVELTDKGNINEPQGKAMVSSNEFEESADKEKNDEDISQSMVSNNNEYLESVKRENSAETETQEQQSMLSNREEEPTPVYLDLDKKSGEKKIVEFPITEESENKANDDDQEDPQEVDHQMNTNENTLSPTESFQSAQFEYIGSPSVTSESFHETKSFENIEFPSTDEDETKEKLFNKEGKEKLDHSPQEKTMNIPSSSSGKKKAMGGKKASGEDKKKKDKGDVHDKIFELLEAKWHMM